MRQDSATMGVAFLLGEQSPADWWLMTPIALAVKTPLAELVLFTLAFAVAVTCLRKPFTCAMWRFIGSSC